MALSIITLSITIKTCDTQHKYNHKCTGYYYADCCFCCVSQISLSCLVSYADCHYAKCCYAECRCADYRLYWVSYISPLCLVSYAECHYAEWRYAECRYAECRYAECRYAEWRYAECSYAKCRYVECRGAFAKMWRALKFWIWKLTDFHNFYFFQPSQSFKLSGQSSF
jgi:hypothetical protein